MGVLSGFVVGVVFCLFGVVFKKMCDHTSGAASIGVATMGILTRMMLGVFCSVGVIGLMDLSKKQLLGYCLVLMVMTSVVHPILATRK